MSQIFFIGAAVCFGLAAFNVGGRINWNSAGFCLVTIAIWLV